MANAELKSTIKEEARMILLSVVKAGRCANGSQLDSGVVRHAMDSKNYHWGSMSEALCGTRPGRRSVGFVSHEGMTIITCEKCIKKADRLGATVIDVQATGQH